MILFHLIADFWLQPRSWVLHKKTNGIKSSKFIFHVLIAALLPVVFTFQLNLWWFVPVIFVSHIFIDFFKTKLKNNIPVFLIDQFLHISVLCAFAYWGTNTEISVNTAVFWIYVSGFVLVTIPMGKITGMLLDSVMKKEEHLQLDVSVWIGIFERILIFIFIVVNQFSAIGFLIAAKSLFRFNNVNEDVKNKTEYFLGTIISFTLAIVVGLLVTKLVSCVQTGL